MGEGNADLHFLEAYRRVEIFLRDAYGGQAARCGTVSGTDADERHADGTGKRVCEPEGLAAIAQ